MVHTELKKQVDVELLLQPQCSDEDIKEATAWVLRSLAAEEDDWYWRKMPSNQALLRVPPTLQHIVHSVTRCDVQEDNLCGVLACHVWCIVIYRDDTKWLATGGTTAAHRAVAR